MLVFETQRLSLHQATFDDAPFIFELLSDSTFIDNIADKGVKNLDDAKAYITASLINSYKANGFGLYIAKQKVDNLPVGLAGLVKRDTLDCPDVGYALLPQYTGIGYATELAKAVLAFGYDKLAVKRIVAITTADNKKSIKVLEKIGLTSTSTITFGDEQCLLFEPQ